MSSTDTMKKHATAHVIMMAAGASHQEVVKSAMSKGVRATHLHQLAVSDEAQNDCRLLLIKLLSNVIQ